MKLLSVGILEVGIVGRVINTGIPSNEYVKCVETKHDSCEGCYFDGHCRTTHNVCNETERMDHKNVIFILTKPPV